MTTTLEITWAETTTEAGCDQNRNTGGTFSHVGMQFRVNQPLKIVSIKADIRLDGTYSMFISSRPMTSGRHLYDIELSKVVSTAPAEISFTPASDFILFPGEHFLALDSTIALGRSDYNVSTFSCDLWAATDIYYTDTLYNYIMPIKLVAYQVSDMDVA